MNNNNMKATTSVCIFAILVAHGGPAAAAGKNCLWSPAGTQTQGASLTIVTDKGKELKIEVPAEGSSFKESECNVWQGEAVHFRAFDKGSPGAAFESFVALEEGGPKLVWSGMTGFAGEFGERTGTFIDYEPPAGGSKTLYPIIYTLSESVQICGFGPAPLNVKMYDPKSSTFRPVSFDRLRRWKRDEKKGWGTGSAAGNAPAYQKPQVLSGKSVKPGDASKKPLLHDLLVFTSSSSSLGGLPEDGGAGPSPLSLGDGDARKGWIEGIGGDGKGEFVTAKTFSQYIPVKGIAIAAARGKSAAEAGPYNAIKKLTVTLDSGKAFTVEIAADPRKNPEKEILVNFPAPVNSSCLSFIIDEVWPSPAAAGDNTFIGEITARSGIEESQGMASLLNSLAEKKLTSVLETILGHLGPGAVAIVDGAWDTLQEEVRGDVVGRTGKNLMGEEGEILPLVSKEVLWASGAKKFPLVGTLAANLAASPELAMKWFDSPPSSEMKDVASLALAAGGFSEAAFEVIGRYLAAPPNDQAAGAGGLMEKIDLKDFIGAALKAPLKDRSGAGLDWCGALKEKFFDPGTPGQEGASVPDPLKKIIMLHLLHESGLTECSGELAGGMWKKYADFDTRYHLLSLTARLISAKKCFTCSADSSGEVLIIKEALQSGDSQLKVAALEALSRAAGKGAEKYASSVVQESLDDAAVPVRIKAAQLFTGMKLESPIVEEKILKLAASDFWPEVRKEAVTAAFKIAQIPEETFLVLLSDKSSDVRKQSVRLTVDKGMKSAAIGKKLTETAADGKMRWDVREEAALAVGTLCIPGLKKDLEKIARAGLSPDSTEAEISAATGAINALGMLGAQDSLEVLEIASLPGIRDELRLASIEAMTQIGGPEAQKILKDLAKSSDARIQKAASVALA